MCLCNEVGVECCPGHNSNNSIYPTCPTGKDIGWLYPGQNLTLNLIAVVQEFGLTPAEIQALPGILITDENGLPIYAEQTLTLKVLLQERIRATCTSITFSIHSKEEVTLITLFPRKVLQSLVIGVRINTMFPPGFENVDERCVCDKRLQKFSNVMCDINSKPFSTGVISGWTITVTLGTTQVLSYTHFLGLLITVSKGRKLCSH